MNRLYSQSLIPKTNLLHYSIEGENDTIDFIVAANSLDIPKPIFLFCQGSLPVPLIIDYDNEHRFETSLSNFDVNEIKDHYHIVVISMPKTPLIARIEDLDKSYCYVTDTSKANSFVIDYLKADYLENYVTRANEVWNFLKPQTWVDTSKFVVAGHSQGARVAVEIAASNQAVTYLGLFGYSPDGRIDQMIWNARNRALKGEITWEKADTIQQYYYDLYNSSMDDNILEKKPELISWKSFSKSSLNKLLALEIPIYIAYGSQDEVAFSVDQLPLRFIEAGKTNYQIKRYPNLEHNFFPIVDGVIDYKNGKWIEVMSSFILKVIK